MLYRGRQKQKENLQGLAMIVGLAISGKLYNTVGPRILSVVGIAIVAVSLFGFTHLTVTTTGADMQPWLILSGIGCIVCTLFTFFIGRDRALEGPKRRRDAGSGRKTADDHARSLK